MEASPMTLMNKDDELQRMKIWARHPPNGCTQPAFTKQPICADSAPFEAYQAVKKRGFRVSKTFLYSIEAALQGMGWKELLDEQKAALNRKLETPDGLRTATAEETAK
jgi:hypothetical protein